MRKLNLGKSGKYFSGSFAQVFSLALTQLKEKKKQWSWAHQGGAYINSSVAVLSDRKKDIVSQGANQGLQHPVGVGKRKDKIPSASAGGSLAIALAMRDRASGRMGGLMRAKNITLTLTPTQALGRRYG